MDVPISADSALTFQIAEPPAQEVPTMLLPTRRLLVPIFAVCLAVGGLAYAAADEMGREAGAQVSLDENDEQALDAGDQGDLLTEDEEPDSGDVVEATGSSGVTPTGRSTEGCPEGFSGNHGQFVSGTEDRPRRDAAHSPCGKPLTSIHGDGEAEGPEDESTPGAHGRARAEEAKSGDHGNGNKRGHDK